ELKDFEHAAARNAYPADFAGWCFRLNAEKGFDAVRWCVRDTHQGTAKDIPVEPHGLVEIRDRDASVTERSRLHAVASSVRSSVFLMCSATRSACATIVSAGLTAAEDGKNDASTTKRLST